MAMLREVEARWLKALCAAVAVLTLARAIISPLGSGALDVLAPIAFLALVVAVSWRSLARPGMLFGPQAGRPLPPPS